MSIIQGIIAVIATGKKALNPKEKGG